MSQLSQHSLVAFFVLFYGMQLMAQTKEERRVDSLDHLAKTTSDIKVKSEVLFELAATFIASDPERSRDYSIQCLHEAEKENYLPGIGDCSNSKGLLHFYQSEYDSATLLFERLLDVGETLQDSILLFKGYGNMGLVYRATGKLDLAIDYFQKSMGINEDMGRQWSVAQLKGDIGGVYMLMGDWASAMAYHREVLNTYTELKSERGQAKAYNSIGVVFQEQLILDSAQYYLEKSLRIKENYGKDRSWFATKANMCRLYYDIKSFQQAQSCFEETIPIAKEFGMKHDLSLSLNNLSLLYSETNQIDKGIKVGLQGLAVAEEIGSMQAKRGANNSLSILYEKKGLYKKALQYAQQSRAVQDSIVNETTAEEIAELKTVYETEKKEQKIELQALEIDNKNQRIKFQRGMMAAVASGLVALFGFVFWRSKQKQKLERQKEALAFQERLLQSTLASVEDERKRISKELHDGIGQQMTGLKLAWEKLSGDVEDVIPDKSQDFQKLTWILGDVANEVRHISHQMMPAALRELGLVPALEDMLTKTFEYSNVTYEFDHVGVEARFPEQIEIGLYRICQELVNNIIKHANATNVEVSLFKSKSHIILNVSDDGRGFNIDNLTNAGNGLNNIQSRVKSVNGDVQYERQAGEGVSAQIRIPINK